MVTKLLFYFFIRKKNFRAAVRVGVTPAGASLAQLLGNVILRWIASLTHLLMFIYGSQAAPQIMMHFYVNLRHFPHRQLRCPPGFIYTMNVQIKFVFSTLSAGLLYPSRAFPAVELLRNGGCTFSGSFISLHNLLHFVLF